MTAIIYGLLGHAGRLELPMESLEVEMLDTGEEMLFNGRVYEIRSIYRDGDEVILNVFLVATEAIA